MACRLWSDRKILPQTMAHVNRIRVQKINFEMKRTDKPMPITCSANVIKKYRCMSDVCVRNAHAIQKIADFIVMGKATKQKTPLHRHTFGRHPYK